MNLTLKKKTVQVATLADASRAVRAEIMAADMGSTVWYRQPRHTTLKIGTLITDDGTVLNVSYNGRIWDVSGNEVFP